MTSQPVIPPEATAGRGEKMLTEYTIQDIENVRDLSLIKDIAKCHIQRSEYYQKQTVDTNEKLLQIAKGFTEKCELDISGITNIITRVKQETIPLIVRIDRQYNINDPVVTASVDTDALVNTDAQQDDGTEAVFGLVRSVMEEVDQEEIANNRPE